MVQPFAVFDIDGTLIRWQLYHAVTDELAKQGFLEPTLYQQIKQARQGWKSRANTDSFKAYEAIMIQGFEDVIKSITVEQFELAVDNVIGQYKDQVYTYTRQKITQLKAKGYILFAISGSQYELVSRIATYYGFDDYIGTDYLKQNGKFTGQKNFYAADKKTALQKLIDKHSVTLAGSLAVGDSVSDTAMLELVDQPIAFNPEIALFDHAKAKRWPIVIERKNVVYQLRYQGGKYILV